MAKRRTSAFLPIIRQISMPNPLQSLLLKPQTLYVRLTWACQPIEVPEDHEALREEDPLSATLLRYRR